MSIANQSTSYLWSRSRERRIWWLQRDHNGYVHLLTGKDGALLLGPGYNLGRRGFTLADVRRAMAVMRDRKPP